MTQAQTSLLQLAAEGYRRAAVYFPDSDCVEYVKEDGFVIYDRVDEFLTLIYDDTKVIPVGFKLKGFKHVFDKHLKTQFKLRDEQFVELVSAIEAICTQLGEDLFTNERRANAYRVAIKLADNDNVKLSGMSMSLKAA